MRATIMLATLSFSSGCATAHRTIDRACEEVARLDRLTAVALTVAPEEGVPDVFVDRYLTPVAKSVVEIHDWCFYDPENK